MRILVVEDDEALANLLCRALKEETYAVDHASDGLEADWLVAENPYDLLILDHMLPQKNGFELLGSWRQTGLKTPVLMLTARDSTTDKVAGLDLGADDYMTKPFELEELLARIRSLLRRKESDYTQAVIEVGPLKVDPARREVSREGKLIELTAKEFGLVEYMARNAGVALTRTQLSEHVWDMNYEANSNVVDVYMGYLRNKLDRPWGSQLVKTVRGHGYMLDAKESAAESP